MNTKQAFKLIESLEPDEEEYLVPTYFGVYGNNKASDVVFLPSSCKQPDESKWIKIKDTEQGLNVLREFFKTNEAYQQREDMKEAYKSIGV